MKNAVCTWDEVQDVDGYNVYLKRPDYALQFDGVDDWVDLDAVAGNFPQGNNARTIEGKFDAENTTGFRWFGYGADVNNGEYLLFTVTSTEVWVAFRGHNWGVDGLSLSGINHVACVIPEGATTTDEALLYLNGNLLNSSTLGGSPRTLNTGGNFARMGTAHNQAAYYNGLIPEVRVWNVERSQQQIQDNKDKLLTGSETGLVAYYPMNEGQGSTLIDHAGNNDGTINGALWTQVGSLDYQKENTSLIPTPEYTIEGLPDGEYEAYCTAMEDGIESEPSNVEVFSVISTRITDDAWVNNRTGEQDTVNNGDQVRAATWSSGDREYGYMKVDISDINDPITLAELKIQISFIYAGTEVIEIHRLSDLTETDNWDETTLTWNNRPLIYTNIIFESHDLSGNSVDDIVTLDVTSLINEYVNAGLDSATIAFRSGGNSTTYRFYSKDQDSNEKPKLTITK